MKTINSKIEMLEAQWDSILDGLRKKLKIRKDDTELQDMVFKID